MQKQSIFILSISMACTLSPRASADLTGPQVVERCKKAYAALKSYRGTTDVLIANKVRGSVSSFRQRVFVQFQRPGMLRVEGKLYPSGRYMVISSGNQTWESSTTSNGAWKSVKNADIATAHWAGGSYGASTTVPAILLNNHWGNPLYATALPKIVRETQEGQPVFRVDVTEASGQTYLWINRKTFLLVKVQRHYALSQIPRPGQDPAPGEGSDGGVMEVVETYNNVKVNAAILKNVFVRPN